MARRFTLRQLEYFVAVGEAGSIAAAAEILSVSSPSISAAITTLEAEFGVQLFIRQHAQGLSLTQGGRRFFKEARRLLDQADGLRDLAGDIAEKPRGPIGVGCLSSFAPVILPSMRRRFETAYPEAQVTQRVADQRRLLDLLHRAEIDVAITYDMEIPADVEFRPLAALPPLALVSAEHPMAERDHTTLAALAEEPMLLLDLPVSRDYFLSLFHAAGLRPRIAERVGDMSVLRSMAANGFGYGLVNHRAPGGASPDGAPLVAVPVRGDIAPLTLGLATIRSDRRARIVEAFEEHCVAELAKGAIPALTP